MPGRFGSELPEAKPKTALDLIWIRFFRGYGRPVEAMCVGEAGFGPLGPKPRPPKRLPHCAFSWFFRMK